MTRQAPRSDTRSDRRARPLPAGVAPGSEISLRQLLEHRLVQLGLGEELLQPGILRLELPKPLRLICLHAPVLVPPAVPARLRHLEIAEHLGEVLAPVEQTVPLTQLADDLLGRVTVTLHRGFVLLPGMLDVGLPQQVDHHPRPGSERRTRDQPRLSAHPKRGTIAMHATRLVASGFVGVPSSSMFPSSSQTSHLYLWVATHRMTRHNERLTTAGPCERHDHAVGRRHRSPDSVRVLTTRLTPTSASAVRLNAEGLPLLRTMDWADPQNRLHHVASQVEEQMQVQRKPRTQCQRLEDSTDDNLLGGLQPTPPDVRPRSPKR